jgi:hypothetical protein
MAWQHILYKHVVMIAMLCYHNDNNKQNAQPRSLRILQYNITLNL